MGMIKRKQTIKLRIGNREVGGDAPITVQSMTNTDTRDVKSTVEQIKTLQDYGCEIIRLAVLNSDAAQALKEIKKQVEIPVIADIHFDYRLAIQSIESGVDALRLNPGNIGKQEFVEEVVKLAKINSVPIRIGVNAGSLQKDIECLDLPLSEKMVMSALRHIKILEDLDFNLIKVSLKSSSVLTTIEAYRKMSETVNYPLHVGITESGTLKNGTVKSSVGIGTLLSEGIGDTIRVSLTENPVEEVILGYEILKALEIRQKGINFISCPTCGRTQINLIKLAKEVQNRFENYDKNITIAVMGCAVNGPGEAKHADYGIAGGIGEGYIFKKGEILLRVKEDELLDTFEKVVKNDKNL